MPPSFPKVELNKKVILAIGITAIILLAAGIYFLFGSADKSSSGKSSSGQDYVPSGSSQNAEADYLSAMRVSEQRNEFLLSEGENKTFNGQTIELVKVGLSSVIIKIGKEEKALGSGKDYSFGELGVRILSTTFSNEAKYGKAIIRLTKLGNTSGGNLSNNQGKEFTLGEGERAKDETFDLSVNSISKEGVSVTFGQETKNIFNTEWFDFGSTRVSVKDIFYTGEPSESRVVVWVTNLGR